MKFIPSLGQIAGACARHPWRVVSAWVTVLIVASVIAVVGLNDILSNEFSLTANFESVRGSKALNSSSLSETSGINETIVLRSLDGTTVDDPAFRAQAEKVIKSVRELQGTWDGAGPTAPPDLMKLSEGELEGSYVLSYYEIQDALSSPFARQIAANSGMLEQVDGMVSADKTVLLIPVNIGTWPVDMAEYVRLVETFDDSRFNATTIGNLSINEVFQQVVAEEVLKAEIFGVPIAIIVLLIVFGSLVAPVVPLALGLMSVGIALGITTIIGQFGDLQLFIQNMITMLGLAIGIDYSLFLVERYREQRANGYSKQRSIEIAGATAGKAVVFSGVTLALAMFGVMLVRINIFYSLSLGAIVVVTIAVLLTATMVPAMLSLIGDKIDWPRKKPVHAEQVDAHNMYQGFWGRITKIVVDRPWTSLLSAVVVLLIMASPVLDMKTGFSRSGQLPPGELTDAYLTLEKDFSAGLLSPVYIIFTGERTPEADAAIQAYIDQLSSSGDFVIVNPARWSDDNRTAEVVATLAYEGSSERAYDAIHRLRSDVGPATIGNVPGLTVYITGQSAGETDMMDHLGTRTPLVFAFVLGLSFVLLLVAFRSVVVPLQAIVFNLLSVAASWGIMVAVFSRGYFRDIFGYNESPIIEMWLPILMFCILFGLSMDYHVFIVSRIREHYDISHNNHEAVAIGLRSTGRIITGAAAIMVVVFGAFSMGSMLSLQQLGFGLAVAVALDATIIRSVLVPSVMTIVGDKNWYLPKWMGWLPDIRIEGDHKHEEAIASTAETSLSASGSQH